MEWISSSALEEKLQEGKIANSGDQNRVGLKNSPYKNRTTDSAK